MPGGDQTLLDPDLASHGGEGVGEGRPRLMVPGAARDPEPGAAVEASTQRTGTTGRPACRQTAVSEQISTTRSPSLYQPGTATRCHGVALSASTSARVGRRSPLVRGRPTAPGRRGGARWE